MSAPEAGRTRFPSRQARRRRVGLLAGAAVLAGADLAVKAAAVAALSTGTAIDLGLVNLRLFYNTGVAFSLGAGLPAWVVVTATGLIIAGMCWFMLSAAPAMNRLMRAGSALLLGGAAGNFIDRLDGRGVVDYLHTGWFPTFNLADVFVTAGAAALVLGSLLRPAPTGDR